MAALISVTRRNEFFCLDAESKRCVITRDFRNPLWQDIFGYSTQNIDISKPDKYLAFPQAKIVGGAAVVTWREGDAHAQGNRTKAAKGTISGGKVTYGTPMTFQEDSVPGVFNCSFLDGLMSEDQHVTLGVYTIKFASGAYTVYTTSTVANGGLTYALWSPPVAGPGGVLWRTGYASVGSPAVTAQQSALFSSSNGGETWAFVKVLFSGAGKFYNETAILNTSGTNWIAFCRVDGETGNPLAFLSSANDFTTLSAISQFDVTEISGRQPNLIKTTDGAAVLMTSDRTGTSGVDSSGKPASVHDKTGMAVWRSTDGFTTYSPRQMAAAMYSTDGGQPVQIEIGTNIVHAPYYYAPALGKEPVIASFTMDVSKLAVATELSLPALPVPPGAAQSTEPFGRSGLKVIAGEEEGPFYGFCGIAKFTSGKWVLIYRKATKHGVEDNAELRAKDSYDKGRTWENDRLLYQNALSDARPDAPAIMANNRMGFFVNRQDEGATHFSPLFFKSDDEGITFSNATITTSSPYTFQATGGIIAFPASQGGHDTLGFISYGYLSAVGLDAFTTVNNGDNWATVTEVALPDGVLILAISENVNIRVGTQDKWLNFCRSTNPSGGDWNDNLMVYATNNQLNWGTPVDAGIGQLGNPPAALYDPATNKIHYMLIPRSGREIPGYPADSILIASADADDLYDAGGDFSALGVNYKVLCRTPNWTTGYLAPFSDGGRFYATFTAGESGVSETLAVPSMIVLIGDFTPSGAEASIYDRLLMRRQYAIRNIDIEADNNVTTDYSLKINNTSRTASASFGAYGALFTNGYQINATAGQSIAVDGAGAGVNFGVGIEVPLDTTHIQRTSAAVYDLTNINNNIGVNAGAMLRLHNTDSTVGSFSGVILQTRGSSTALGGVVLYSLGANSSDQLYLAEGGSHKWYGGSNAATLRMTIDTSGNLILPGSFQTSGTAPYHEWNETDRAADEKIWRAYGTGSQWNLYPVSDAGVLGTVALSFQRTGSAATGCTINPPTTFGSTVALNADPTTALQAATKQYSDKKRRTLTINTTGVGNVGAGEDDLITYSLPAATLAVNGDSAVSKMGGSFAASVNNKRLRFYFGATLVLDTGALAVTLAGSWTFEMTVTRTAAATQKIIAILNTSQAAMLANAAYVTAAETLSGAVTIKATAEATSNDDLRQEMLTVEFVNNS